MRRSLMFVLAWVLVVVSRPVLAGDRWAKVPNAAHLVHTAQVIAWDEKGKVSGDLATQADRVIANIEAILQDGKISSLDDVVKWNVAAVGNDGLPAFRAALMKKLGRTDIPISIVQGKLFAPEALIAADAVAVAKADARGMSNVPGQPAGLSGTHRSILPGGARVSISGQAETSADLSEATSKTMASLFETLAFLKLKPDDTVQIKSFLQPMSSVDVARKEIEKAFEGRPVPPLVFVDWISSKTTPIEIELIASAGPAAAQGETVEFLAPPKLKPSPVFSRIARINRGDVIYTQGFLADPSRGVKPEVDALFDVLGSTLKEAGSDFRHLAKATYYVSTDASSKYLNEIRPKFYDPTRPPAASKAVVPGIGVDGNTITFDFIAVEDK